MSIHNVISLRPRVVTLRIGYEDRKAIEEEVERLLTVLDDLDGDPDLEPETDLCTAGDDGCGEFYLNGPRWGSEYADTPEWAPAVRELER